MRQPSLSDKTGPPSAPLCRYDSDDGVPDCDTGPLGRLRWAVSELVDIIRGHRTAHPNEGPSSHVPHQDATS